MQDQSGTDANTTQHTFLATLRQGCPEGLHFLVAQRVTWTDKETGADREAFPAEEWREQYLDGPWYFSTGASDDRKSRRYENTKAFCAIVIDDVGTKVPWEKVLAAPSWVIETSPGNFQLGFRLKEWSTDIQAGDDLFAGLVEAGLQDKGVNRCCRLFRIPDSVNDKPGRDGFRAVLHDFNPSIVYTLKTLAKALKVKPGKASTPRTDSGERPFAGQPDPVFAWMLERGMVRHECSMGWWEVACPWPEEHTDGRTETKFRPLGASPDGRSGVKCFHGHGEDATAYKKRFFQWVLDQGGPPEAMPTLDATLREVLRFAAESVKPKKDSRHPQPEEPAEVFNFGTLQAAIGPLPKSALLHQDKNAEGHHAKLQPCTYGNAEAGLAYLGVQVRLNLMTGKTGYILPERIDMARFGAKSAKEIDGMIEGVLCDVFKLAGIKDKRDLRDCFARIANSLYWHPAKDWIESKEWDGVDRFQALCDTLTTDTPDLLKTYLRRWLLQGIEAVCGWATRRESQKSLCFVLAGDQGIGKTSWLMSLAPGFSAEGKHLHLDGNNARDSKHEALQGMVVELGELDTTFTKSAVGSLKAFLSGMTDEYRLPYADSWLTRPRCTSFCASVNLDQFLQDTSGNRRFASIKITACDYKHGIDVQQLWAQFRTYWAAGEQYWLTDEETKLQTASNDTFQTLDGIVQQIGDEIERRKDRSAFPLECSLNMSTATRLLGLRFEDRAIVTRVGVGLRKHLGSAKNLRKSGGAAEAWAIWLNAGEVSLLGVKVLKRVGGDE